MDKYRPAGAIRVLGYRGTVENLLAALAACRPQRRSPVTDELALRRMQRELDRAQMRSRVRRVLGGGPDAA